MSQDCDNLITCCPAVDPYYVVPNTGKYLVTVVIDPTGGGTATGDGEHDQFSNVTVVATPAVDFGFVEWQDAFGKQLSTDESYTFVLNANTILTAKFQEES